MYEDVDMEPSEPFMLFAVESPSYSYLVLAGYSPDASRDRDAMVAGSMLIIGGGYVSVKTRDAEHPCIQKAGCLTAAGWRFAQGVVAELVSPRDRITVVYDKFATTTKDWANQAQGKGFDIMDTENAVVALGEARSLRDLDWLEGVDPTSYTSLFSSPQSESTLERSVIEAARAGVDARSIMHSFWLRTRENPGTIVRELAGCDLVSIMGGHIGSDVYICLSDANVDRIREVLRQVAADLGILLYDAGTITELHSTGYSSRTEDWQPMPPGWKRIS